MIGDISEVRDSAHSSLDRIRSAWPELVEGSETNQFIFFAKAIGPLCHYKIFSEQAHQVIEAVQSKYGEEAVHAFLRIVLLKRLLSLINDNELDALPRIIRNHQLNHLRRISLLSDTESEWLRISHDLFHKEFGLVSLRLLAAGAQLIDVRCGIPRSILLKKGFIGFPSLANYFSKLGGFKPYFQIHTHTFNLDQFNEQGWEECYLGCTALYETFPDALGMFGGSWFYDPALEKISPHLKYLRETPLAGGARIIYFSTDDESKANALSSSTSRRALFEQGKYLPKNYMLIWGKADQIMWARKKAN